MIKLLFIYLHTLVSRDTIFLCSLFWMFMMYESYRLLALNTVTICFAPVLKYKMNVYAEDMKVSWVFLEKGKY